MNRKSATLVQPKVQPEVEPSKKTKGESLAKTSVAYWKPRVKIPSGKAHYAVQIAHHGRRRFFSLETADKSEAAAKAKNIYLAIVGKGMDAALATLRPETATKITTATVGGLIEAATRLSSARPETLLEYSKALRRITAGVLGIKSQDKTHDAIEATRIKIDKTPLDKLTPASVLAWKNRFLAAADDGERGQRAVTINSLIRNSKALLSKKVRPFIEKELVLPDVLWFDGITPEATPSTRYSSKIDAEGILRAGQTELATTQPQAFRALVLCLVLGLRRSEADALLWAQVDLQRGTVELKDTDAKRLKSKDSAGILQLDEGTLALFKTWYQSHRGTYVMEQVKSSRIKLSKGRSYRCDVAFDHLAAWLRGQGMQGLRPIHTLRKEVGSVIATTHGILAASRYLRHSNISITSSIYADLKAPITSGLGQFLTAGKKK